MADRVVAYFYDEQSAEYSYNNIHPWRPLRSKLVHTLINGYNLTQSLLVHRPRPSTYEELTEFHADDYIRLLQNVTPDNFDEYKQQLKRFNMGGPQESDCPVFDGMLDYFSLLAGGSVDGAAMLAQGRAQIAINWAGGMHHAKKAEASGFCYINDIVMGILELLKTYQRVLYVDIDIHHGDGVEEAFYLTDRVMTVSFHRYGDYFPGTGSVEDVGHAQGAGYTVNVPLQDGMDDESYRTVYEPIMSKVMSMYQPEAIVVCSGADSLSGDRLGCFNLSLQGHSNCVEFLARYNVPMLVVGGGGYTLRNVARCWAYETGRLMGLDLPDPLPPSCLTEFDYYMDSHRLRIEVSNMRNQNKREDLERITATVLANLAHLPPVPSVGMHQPPPPTKVKDLPEEEMEVKGGGQAYEDARRVKAGDEDEEGVDWDSGDKKAALRREAVAPPVEVKAETEVKAEVKAEAAAPAAESLPHPAVAASAGGSFGGFAARAPSQGAGGAGPVAAFAVPAGDGAAAAEAAAAAPSPMEVDAAAAPEGARGAPGGGGEAAEEAAVTAGGAEGAAAPAGAGGGAQQQGRDISLEADELLEEARAGDE